MIKDEENRTVNRIMLRQKTGERQNYNGLVQKRGRKLC